MTTSSPITGRTHAITAVIAALAAAATALYLGALLSLPPLGVGLVVAPWVLALGTFVADAFPLHLEFGGQAHTFTLYELPVVIGLFGARPRDAALACLVGTLASRLAFRRYGLQKITFNTALTFFEICTIIAVFRHVGPSTSLERPGTWPTVLGAVAVANMLTALLVSVVIALAGSRVDGRALLRTTTLAVGTSVAMASLGLAATIVLSENPAALVLIAPVGAALVLAYRGYTTLFQRYAGLRLLHAFSEGLVRTPELETAVSSILARGCEVLRAAEAEVVLFATDGRGGAAHRVARDASGADVRRHVPVEGDWVWVRVVAQRESMLLTRASRDPGVVAYLESHDVKDMMLAPLIQGDRVVGLFAVRDRMTNVSTFSSSDLDMFATMAIHATMALDNARLVDRLRREAADREHEASHDALTGLPNRVLFNERVEAALTALPADGTARCALLLMDLNRFKEVNDTLGHNVGDRVLVEVADRLARFLPPAATVARLGGDEFAVLLPSVPGITDAVHQAQALRSVLAAPIALDDGLDITVDAAIGLSIGPDHGHDRSTLMKRADVAMYEAKEHRATAVELYAPTQERSSARQLALVADLRQALQREELTLHYQPKVSMATGEVSGVEALARWYHPLHGTIPPDEFISLAEHSGLIHQLTSLVLRRALLQAKEWSDHGIELRVAVNLSARSLRDAHLPALIIRQLSESGMPAAGLTFEITEGELMVDVATTTRVLGTLHAMGIRLSIDDFGTGYSSLSYLAQLPVDEVKIDKSFVLDVVSDPAKASIVKAIVDLATSLGLDVGAEGVENEAVWDRLAGLGCASAQGYHIARPAPGEQMAAVLSDWRARYATLGPAAADVVEPGATVLALRPQTGS